MAEMSICRSEARSRTLAATPKGLRTPRRDPPGYRVVDRALVRRWESVIRRVSAIHDIRAEVFSEVHQCDRSA